LALAIDQYLPTSGAVSELDRSYSNPTSTTSGQFGGEVLALALNLGFDYCDPDFAPHCVPFKELYVCDNRNVAANLPNCVLFYFQQVKQIFETANAVLGNCPTSGGETPDILYQCLRMINTGFPSGGQSVYSPYFRLTPCPPP
jgi:hypothetical protein